MRMSQISTSASSTNDYLYNDKQLQSSFNLNWYDYSARMYDPALGRFTTVDPLAGKYDSYSPYHFCGNNPILLIDGNGMEYWTTKDPRVIERFMNAVKGFDFEIANIR
jgi:RHS repeat-associated protein